MAVEKDQVQIVVGCPEVGSPDISDIISDIDHVTITIGEELARGFLYQVREIHKAYPFLKEGELEKIVFHFMNKDLVKRVFNEMTLDYIYVITGTEYGINWP